MPTLLPNRRMPRRTATAIQKTFPAPVGGWNAKNSLAAMGMTDAKKLENWFPNPTSVDMRGGSTRYHTNLSGIVKTLAVFKAMDGQNTLWSFTDAGIHESTFGGAGASILTARTNGKHQWDQFGDGTHNWLIAVNGVDKPWYWNGTTYVEVDDVSSPAITGILSTDIIGLAVFKERLCFIRNDMLGFDYLPAGAAGGATNYFDLSSFASDGGYLMAICSWSRDAGDGPDDYFVAITSEGQALVYKGTDPSSANTWGLVGVFKIGKPIGRRCVLKKYGSDPIVLTQDGAFALSTLLQSGDERNKFAISFKIQSAFTEAARSYADVFGWTIISFPEQNAILVNVPKREDGPHEQYVMNTISKAWCKFTGWNAEDLIVYEGELYFSCGPAVFKAWTGTDDNGYKINYEAELAYQDFGTSALKDPLMFMPVFESNRQLTYATGIDTDFVSRAMNVATSVRPSSGGRWGISQWGNAKWSSGSNIVKNWGGTASWPGHWLSGKVRIVSDEVTAKWIGSVIRFNVGEGL